MRNEALLFAISAEVENECTSYNFWLFAILYQNLSDLVEVWHSYNKNNFAYFLRHAVYLWNISNYDSRLCSIYHCIMGPYPGIYFNRSKNPSPFLPSPLPRFLSLIQCPFFYPHSHSINIFIVVYVVKTTAKTTVENVQLVSRKVS